LGKRASEDFDFVDQAVEEQGRGAEALLTDVVLRIGAREGSRGGIGPGVDEHPVEVELDRVRRRVADASEMMEEPVLHGARREDIHLVGQAVPNPEVRHVPVAIRFDRKNDRFGRARDWPVVGQANYGGALGVGHGRRLDPGIDRETVIRAEIER